MKLNKVIGFGGHTTSHVSDIAHTHTHTKRERDLRVCVCVCVCVCVYAGAVSMSGMCGVSMS